MASDALDFVIGLDAVETLEFHLIDAARHDSPALAEQPLEIWRYTGAAFRNISEKYCFTIEAIWVGVIQSWTWTSRVNPLSALTKALP